MSNIRVSIRQDPARPSVHVAPQPIIDTSLLGAPPCHSPLPPRVVSILSPNLGPFNLQATRQPCSCSLETKQKTQIYSTIPVAKKEKRNHGSTHLHRPVHVNPESGGGARVSPPRCNAHRCRRKHWCRRDEAQNKRGAGGGPAIRGSHGGGICQERGRGIISIPGQLIHTCTLCSDHETTMEDGGRPPRLAVVVLVVRVYIQKKARRWDFILPAVNV